jgi:protein MpaA
VARTLVSLLLSLAWAGAAPSATDLGQQWGTLRNDVTGHSVRVPPGWFAAVRADDGTTIVGSRPIADVGRSPGTIRLRSRDTFVWIFQYRGMKVFAGDEPARPRRFRLPPRGSYDCGYGDGHRLLFSERGQRFHVFVRRGEGASERTALRILDSLRLTVRAAEVANERARLLLGRSYDGRPIRAWRIGNPGSPRKLLVVGCIHGNECAGTAVTQRLVDLVRPIAADLWVIQNLNPDGLARGTRQNARGVDLNRNFPSQWRAAPRGPEYPGPRPASERETRIAMRLIERVRPDVTLWFHQPQDVVRAWGPSRAAARRYARLAGARYASLRWPPGTAANWQNRRFHDAASFVVELAPGALSAAAADRHARAILALGE